MTPFPDPEDLRIDHPAPAKSVCSGRPPRHRPTEPVLKGPIPLAWLERAGRLPGKALAVALVLWYLAGLTGKRTVHICLTKSRRLGLTEASARRGLKALEGAKLVEVRRLPGRGLEVTLLDVRFDGDARADDGLPNLTGNRRDP
jgi:hypothetical protein